MAANSQNDLTEGWVQRATATWNTELFRYNSCHNSPNFKHPRTRHLAI